MIISHDIKNCICNCQLTGTRLSSVFLYQGKDIFGTFSTNFIRSHCQGINLSISSTTTLSVWKSRFFIKIQSKLTTVCQQKNPLLIWAWRKFMISHWSNSYAHIYLYYHFSSPWLSWLKSQWIYSVFHEFSSDWHQKYTVIVRLTLSGKRTLCIIKI